MDLDPAKLEEAFADPNTRRMALGTVRGLKRESSRKVAKALGVSIFHYQEIELEASDPEEGSWDSAAFEEFLWAAGNFGAGFVDATASNLAFGRGRHEFSNSDFQAGQATGDFVSIFWGLYEVAGGIGGFTTGTLFDLAPGGVLVGVPVQVASAATIIHGGTTSLLGYAHLMEANQKGGGKTGRKINAKREEKIKRDIEAAKAKRDAAKTKAERIEAQSLLDHLRRKLKKSEVHWR